MPLSPTHKHLTPEAAFSRQIRNDLAFLGVRSRKINDRVTSGIPDIYFAPNGWIESKVIGGNAWPRNPPLKYFTGLQKSTLDEFTQAGCQTYAAILWETKVGEQWFLFMPWWHFRRITFWEPDVLAHFGIHVTKGSGRFLQMDRFFVDGKWDHHWMDERWLAWPHSSNPVRFKVDFKEATLAELVEAET